MLNFYGSFFTLICKYCDHNFEISENFLDKPSQVSKDAEWRHVNPAVHHDH